jgi:hypothetical protein
LAQFSHYNISHFLLYSLSVTAREGSNTLGLQPVLYKFDNIFKEMEGNAFSLTSARVPTCPAERVIWNILKIQGK